MTTSAFASFDASEYLDTPDLMAEYLAACLEDPNPDVFLSALADVAKAKGMTGGARRVGLGRESLYKGAGTWRQALRDDPRLLLERPAPPPFRAAQHLAATAAELNNWQISGVTIHRWPPKEVQSAPIHRRDQCGGTTPLTYQRNAQAMKPRSLRK